MRKSTILALAALWAGMTSCKQANLSPRPTIPLVYSILADTTGTAGLVASAGRAGEDFSIAIIGEPGDAIALARHFQYADRVDNISGKPSRDSLPDFAGERFDVILDAVNAPYGAYVSAQGMDSLREAAVNNAVFAWDSTCYRSATDKRPLLGKQRSSILIYTSSLQASYGVFDADTLQQLAGGKSRILSPVPLMLEKALEGGALNLAVWTDRASARSHTWETAFEKMKRPGASIAVICTDEALDIRTEFRQLLRQYRSLGKSLDVLLLDTYRIAPAPLLSELELIRMAGTEEDALLDKLLSPAFSFIDPASVLLDNTYRILRDNHLFSHRIALPALMYYETATADDGSPILVEVASSYVQRSYVSDLD